MPSTNLPLRVAVLCSHRAPALRHLLEQGSNRRRSFEVVACLTSEESFAEEDLVRKHGIPLLTHSLRRFCASYQWCLSDRTARCTFDAITRGRLSAYDVDIVVLDAYLYVLSDLMLNAYPGRIINVHHSDFARSDAAGLPRFPGLRAVRDAIFAGAADTRATAHLVTAGLDQGPPLLRSWAFAVAPLVEIAPGMGCQRHSQGVCLCPPGVDDSRDVGTTRGRGIDDDCRRSSRFDDDRSRARKKADDAVRAR